MFSSDDYIVDEFRGHVQELDSSEGSSFSPETEDEDTLDDELSDIEVLSILPQGEKGRVDPIGSCDAERKESIDSDSMMAIASANDDSDDTTWLDGIEQGDPSDDAGIGHSTRLMKASFLRVIGATLERTCGLDSHASGGGIRYVKNGTSRFSSIHDGKYSFYRPGHKVGGADVFGTEYKYRGTSKTGKYKDKLQIQVAGDMLATVFHRNVLENRVGYTEQILEACPNLQGWRAEPSRTVYYLVFTRLSLRIAKAVFDLKYLRYIQQGYLPRGRKADIKWSQRLRLDHEEDLGKAARLVMCLMLNLRDEFLSGKHYWLPYKRLVRGGSKWVRE